VRGLSGDPHGRAPHVPVRFQVVGQGVMQGFARDPGRPALG
jgi:hypothetical protein